MSTSSRFRTGVSALDRKLGGGIPPGSIVTFLAEPASQAELFLAGLAGRHETLYLSAERSPTAVTNALREQTGDSDDVAVMALDCDAPAVDALEYVERLPDDAVLVLDPLEPLERLDPGEYRTFLEQLETAVERTDGIAVLHGLKHAETPAQRHRSEYVADIVLDLVTEYDDDAIENRLVVPKFRGGAALAKPLTLQLTDRISVDTSRDIA